MSSSCYYLRNIGNNYTYLNELFSFIIRIILNKNINLNQCFYEKDIINKLENSIFNKDFIQTNNNEQIKLEN